MFKTFLAHTCTKTDSELNYTRSWYSLLTSALDFRMGQMLPQKCSLVILYKICK